MKFTIFIDESGDFETSKGEWILGGFLCFEDFQFVNSKLFEIFNNYPSQNNLSSIRDFHFTELKSMLGFDKAFLLAKAFIESTSRLPFKNYFISTIDYTKTKLGEKESTYRLMLLDIISIAESLFTDDIIIESFDIVIATRTIDGVLQTNKSQIEESVFKVLEDSIEYGLATRGLLKLLSKNRINIQLIYANSSWGLVFADCISNLLYNQKYDKQREFIESLRNNKRLISFESFGGLDKRKALIAERDGDYVQSLFYWLTIKKSKDINDNYLQEAFNRNWKVISEDLGSTGITHTIESLIEKLWRNFDEPHQYHLLIELLIKLDNQIQLFSNEFERNTTHILFRLRNFLILILNHTGNCEKTEYYLNKQSQQLINISTNPEFFNQIIDYRINEIEFKVNSLNILDCLNLTERFLEFIQNYKLSLEILLDSGEMPQNYFESSRLFLKSEMTFLRISLYSILSEDRNMMNQILSKIEYLKNINTNPKDYSRLINLEIMALLKSKKIEEAIDLAYKNLLNYNNIFNLFWLLKSVNDGILSNIYVDSNIIKNIISKSQELKLNVHQGHPYDLVYRELSLFYFLNNKDKSKSLEYLKKSRKSLLLLDNESPIYKWLFYVSDAISYYITNNSKPQFPNELTNLNGWLQDANNIMLSSLTKEEYIHNIRYITPY